MSYETKTIQSPESASYSFQDASQQIINFKQYTGLRGEQYNFKTHLHSPENRQELFYYTPISFVEQPFINGAFMQYNIDNLENSLLCDYYMHLKIVNADLVNALTLPNIPESIEQLVIVKSGTEITNSTKSYLIRLYNELDLTEQDKTYQRDLRGLTSTAAAFITIPANSSAEFFFKLPLSISDNYILQQSLTEQLKIKVTFKQGISQGLVSNNDVQLEIANIYSSFIRTDYVTTSFILKQPWTDYNIIRPQEYEYSLNQLINGTQYTVNLTSFHPESAFLIIFINKQNPATKFEAETYYGIQDIELVDSQNKNIHNNVIFNKVLNKNTILQYFSDIPYMKERINDFVVLNFCINPKLVLNQQQGVCGSQSFNGIDYKLNFTADTTSPVQTNQLNIISWNYGYLRVLNGRLYEYLNSSVVGN